MNPRRRRLLKPGNLKPGPIVYWMSRDQRHRDNWALLFAQELARRQQTPLLVVFCLVANFLGATSRHYDFLLRGLQELEQHLANYNIPFHLLPGPPEQYLPPFLAKISAGALVGDFDPLRLKKQWQTTVATQLNIPFYQVDTHNIVPVWAASPKQEYGAYTLRPKLHRLLPAFLEDFPSLEMQPSHGIMFPPLDWPQLRADLNLEPDVAPVDWLVPGEEAAQAALEFFLANKLPKYHEVRNDPTLDGQSNLSPYLHFGHLAPQRLALAVEQAEAPLPAKEAFLEELIVRRELADNFCFYNPHYDSIQGFPAWAQKTLEEHREDARPYIYSPLQLEQAQTHDDLWNAAQMQMVHTGKMPGYLRMYWAKKILEWTETPETALRIAINLNDRYELDGRDPNGYTGIAWSLGGVHDRAWGERPIFGKIRYMSYKGCKAKFDVAAYTQKNLQKD